MLLPAGVGLFGTRLTSPLKAWDYLASGRPIVAADTPALRSAVGEAAAYYPPGDADAFIAVLERVSASVSEREQLVAAAQLRTWADRAAELEAFIAGVAP